MQEKRKLSTILFADISGYTSLMGSDEKYALGLLNQFKDILEQFVPAHQGEIIQYFGDGYLLSGRSCTEAKPFLLKTLELDRQNLEAMTHLGDITVMENDSAGLQALLARTNQTPGFYGRLK